VLQEISLLCDVRNTVGESPIWSIKEQALYWVDIEGRKIHRLCWHSRSHASWVLPERIGCMALSVRGTVIAALETGIAELELQDSAIVSFRPLARINHPANNMRFNDGRCDAKGRFWISTMCRDMSLASEAGGIYCLDAGGLRGPVLTGYITPNGMAFNRDATLAYLSDSHPSQQKIWTHKFDLDTGRWGPKNNWVDMTDMPGRPDGAAMDTEGCYWICANDAGKVYRFSASGELLRTIDVPMSKPSMCAFGGPNLRHMFVTSIKPPSPVKNYDYALEGAIVVLDPDAKGIAEPLFSQFPVVHALFPLSSQPSP
jgi:sugar lactone lactonase YvrE